MILLICLGFQQTIEKNSLSFIFHLPSWDFFFNISRCSWRLGVGYLAPNKNLKENIPLSIWASQLKVSTEDQNNIMQGFLIIKRQIVSDLGRVIVSVSHWINICKSNTPDEFPSVWYFSIWYIAHEAKAVSNQHKHFITAIYLVPFCFFKGNRVVL